ncbi:Aromatic peroxygenase [Phytophthora citrophthora]|uniref:Aromatic peroxygenase n=1 Tax=Phytophthora citrophthora TaxID=4793 RepID=A0AAD9LKS7_9STRA|nr:Aromatic peroxygenase [Phytophthora citrophthora]
MTKRVVNPAFIILMSIPIAVVLNILLFVNKPKLVVPQHVDMSGPYGYFRPSGDQVSGFKDSSAKYHRSPCPALNVLANHGYIPRDGKVITPRLLQKSLVKVYNLDPTLAEFLVSTLPDQFTLADLGVHNFVEHDASLIHDDSWTGGDPSSINTTLAANLLSRGDKDHRLTRTTLASFRREREVSSAANTPNFNEMFTAERALTAYSEAAVLLLVLGEESMSISVDDASAFLVDERIPDNYAMPRTPVTLARSLWVTFQLKMFALSSAVFA